MLSLSYGLLLRLLETLNDTSVGRFLHVVLLAETTQQRACWQIKTSTNLIPRARRTLASESARNPRVLRCITEVSASQPPPPPPSTLQRETIRTHLISEVPDRNAHTPRHGVARPDDGRVVRLLLREARGGGRERREADVELGDRDLDAERGELLHVLLQRRGHAADGEVALDPDAVDGYAGRLERLDEVLERCRLRAYIRKQGGESEGCNGR